MWKRSRPKHELWNIERESNYSYLRFMRVIFSVLFVFGCSLCFGQQDVELKNRYLGSYKGTIPSYQISTGFEVIDVSETPIYVHLMKDEITVTIGSKTSTGTYVILFKADDYYLVDATMEGQLATERILVYKRGKHISRDGMYPQPVTELDKFKGR